MEVKLGQVSAAFQPGGAQEGVQLAQRCSVLHQQVHPEVLGALVLDLHVEEPVQVVRSVGQLLKGLDVIQLLGDVVAHLGGALLVYAEVALSFAGASSDVGHIEFLPLVRLGAGTVALVGLAAVCFRLEHAAWRRLAHRMGFCLALALIVIVRVGHQLRHRAGRGEVALGGGLDGRLGL